MCEILEGTLQEWDGMLYRSGKATQYGLVGIMSYGQGHQGNVGGFSIISLNVESLKILR